MEQKKVRYAALYERLSRDDELKGESNSITNQKAYLEDYIKSQGITNYRHFTDDGYSGTGFDRPGFQAMIAAVEAGEVDVVCVKDLSRFGRNYLKVGFYTEMLFPDKGVRFIAINNGVDSANPTDNDFTPFMNIMNEWYAKDTSNKIRAVFKARMQNGKRCSGAIPYGYKRDPEDKNHLLIDEEAADVVRRIYQMVLDGMGAKAIADKLSEDKVLIPSAYLEQCKNGNVSRNHSYHDPYRWNNTAVGYILDKQEYMGHTVRMETHKEDIRLIEETQNWLRSPERKAPKKEREYAIDRLDGVVKKIRNSMQNALNKLQTVLMKPSVKNAGKEKIKEKAKESIYSKLARAKISADTDNQARWEQQKHQTNRKKDMEL